MFLNQEVNHKMEEVMMDGWNYQLMSHIHIDNI
jgi:hypothetical protein